MLPLAALLCAGCAKTPSGVSDQGQTLITFQVQLRGAVQPDAYYYILLDTNNDPGDGPVPVVARPWGNGFAAGSYTHYVVYNGGVFSVYESSDADHTQSTYLGRPLQAAVITTNTPNDTLFVQLDRSQIANVHPDVHALDVNFVATDRVPLDTEGPVSKTVDGLGRSGNAFVTIPLTFTTTYVNGGDPDPGNPETANDAPGLDTRPDLDITNWRITVHTDL
jgi:hypothetical protein